MAQVAAGANHTCAVTTAGGLWCWGANADGQLGLGDTTSHPNPTQVAASGYAEIQVSQPDIYGGFFDGRGSSCARKTDATVWCWGANGDGQLGDGTTVATNTPVQVQTASGALSGVTRLTMGDAHSCAVKADGTVWCWGYNGEGELGLGDTVSRSAPTQLPLTGVPRISTSASHTCAVKTNGA